ncbi:MAG: ISLre2 family transposase [Actinobacteria bacterium]|nr:ISLre2 family transposase [Actinomycetota bacterium]
MVSEAKGIGEIEEKIAKLVFELGRWMLEAVFAYLDWRLAKRRGKGLRMVGERERNVLTRLGVVRVRRRYYRDEEGRYRFLLDEALGWDKGGMAVTPAIEARALEMCSELSYRKSAKHLSFFLAEDLRHPLLHRLVQERGEERAAEKRQRAQELFSLGVLPPSEKREAERLFLEADGCMISLQREKRKKHEVKVGISYEGWSQVGEDKWRTLGRRACLSAADGGTFLSCWSADLACVYDHSRIGEVIWSSDGASWLARGPDLFTCTHAQLDRFHLARSLTRALGFSCEAFRLFALAKEGKAAEVVAGLEGHLGKAADEGKKKRISEAIAYISSLSAWLRDWKDVLAAKEDDRSPGAIEGNVDKLAADRFKKRGMSWRPSGADHMCQIIELKENGDLGSYVTARRKADEKAAEAAMASLRREVRRNPEAWLRKNMPLLEVRSGDPWVKDVLRVLAGHEKIAC